MVFETLTLKRISAAAGAIWGFSLVLAAYPWIVYTASPDAPVSLGSRLGFDPGSSFRLVGLMLVTPFVMALLSGRIIGNLSARRGWTHLAAFVSAVVYALWMTIELRHPTSFVLALLLPPVAVFVWGRAPRAIRLDRWDTLLLPFWMALYCVVMDLTPLHWVYASLWALGLTLLVRIFVVPLLVEGMEPRPESQALVLWLTPLAVLPLSKHLGLPEIVTALSGVVAVAALAAIGTVLVRRRGSAFVTRWLMVLVLPIFAIFYPHTQDMMTAEGAPRLDFFEDGHGLLPASEWLRGERPYRDMIPGHGFLSDGGIDVLGIVLGGDTAGSARIANHWAHELNSFAIFLLTLAATSSAPAALMALLFAMTFFDTGTGFFRSAIPLMMLAATVAGARLNQRRWWTWSGALLPIAALSAVEFAAYSTLVTLVALIRSHERGAALRAFGKGLLITGGPIALGLVAVGLLDDFVRVTINEVLRLGPVYNLGIGPMPELAMRAPHLPDIFRPFLFPNEARHLLWPLAVITAATIFSVFPRRAGRGEEFLLVCLWIGLAGLSWAERHHLYLQFALPSLIVMTIVMLWRRGSQLARAAAVLLGFFAAVSASPSQHLINQAVLRTTEGPMFEAVELEEPPRARGVLFRPEDAERVKRFNELVEAHLGPDETWLDFANRPILHYLFDRDAPIRQYEVPFFQSAYRQDEVIRHVRRNPDVRWAITRFGHSEIDSIPNEDRAPMVAAWIAEHFEPWYDDGDIAIWRRK